MAGKFHDEEFSPEILDMLRRRDILGSSNPAHFAILRYNAYTQAEAIVQKFQDARRQNPLLETTPAEAWLTSELVPAVEQIRANADLAEPILDSALKRFFRLPVHTAIATTSSEQHLCTSLDEYLPSVKALLMDLYDRRKSLRGILRIPVTAYTVREALSARKPASKREAIFLEGINAGWKDHRIARTLDEQRIKPRTFESYRKMLRTNPQNFYSLKATIKKKYEDSVTPQTHRLAISREKSKV